MLLADSDRSLAIWAYLPRLEPTLGERSTFLPRVRLVLDFLRERPDLGLLSGKGALRELEV